ncbi:MAG: D-glycero-beta-D-manno-heptose 1-phosphate adenylyltransferase [Bacteroidetes bacterium]|nr:D-glycero-beta-D-manno-heptose 1-phosphate adenylyltransferase [Bacteroidota bacterium]
MNTNPKIWKREEARQFAAGIKASGKRIVFTNGCFDILHAGHVTYLQEAATLGDFLVVGVNSDDSVKRLDKSPARPLQNEFSRSTVLAALQFVGAVIVFDEDTPLELIQAVKPDVLVKGADYKIEDILGAKEVLAAGGEVKTLEFLPGYSTSNIEKKILEANQNI